MGVLSQLVESLKTCFVMDLFKFPRTKHLFDIGGSGVSRDDLLMDSGEEAYFYGEGGAARGYAGKGRTAKNKGSPTLVAIEEKVDGANIGISIEPESLRIRVQNRAHFVDSKTHRQFSTLDSWVEEHANELYRILNSDELVGHYVLFGEWLYAMHSIAYTRLPNYFLAFDLYDTKKCQFFSWRERNRRLEGTGISTVRLIAEEAITGRKDVSIYMFFFCLHLWKNSTWYSFVPVDILKLIAIISLLFCFVRFGLACAVKCSCTVIPKLNSLD